MIKKFSVKNFKNFKEQITLDFTKSRDYSFNQDLIKNGLINKMLIYGKNNSGKSNLGVAIMDITTHLTNNLGFDNTLRLYYLNGDSVDDVIEFKYEFLLNGKNIKYSYIKNFETKLLYEELIEEDKILFKYNYKTNKYENNIEEAKTIDISKRSNNDISVLKYIYNNTLYWNESSTLKLLIEFVSNMLWFRSVKSNEFIGLLPNNESLSDFIIKENLLKEFEKFLKECGQNYKLVELEQLGKRVIGVKYKNYTALFSAVASTGTLSLWLFFYWMHRTDKISFVYLDEFDAFYHYELSAYILKLVNSKSEFQSVLTSHNTFLINNELMRPDCYSILSDGKISSFADSTNKTIRQGHNLEKMMLGGEFEI